MKKINHKKISSIVNTFTWGQFIVSKVQFLVTLTILLGVFKVKMWICFAMMPILLVLIYVIGHIFNKHFRQHFMEEQFKDVGLNIKKGKK